MSESIETERKRCLNVADAEKVFNAPIKQDIEWLAEDSHTSEVVNQGWQVDAEPLRSLKAEEDPYHTDAEPHAVQGFTPVPQTDECIKTELMLDEEFMGHIKDTEANCKQQILADGPVIRASISDKKTKTVTTELSSHSGSPKGLPKERKGVAHRERIFKCELCPRDFKRQYDLKRHLLTHCKIRNREFACDLCERMFYSNNILERHKKAHTKKRRAKFRIYCEVCGSSFTQNGNLKRHMLSKHLGKAQSEQETSEQARFECEICSRSCKSKYNLKLHLRTHDADRKRNFACDSCDSKFYARSMLYRHMKVHNRATYHCKVCEKRFAGAESLKVHMLRHRHFDETQRYTPESSNDVAVPMKSELISDEEFIDEESHPPALAVDSEQQTRVCAAADSVTCEVCHNSYPRELMDTHMRIAHSDKTYKCDCCARLFLDKSNLKRHLQRVSLRKSTTSNRPLRYICEQCGSKFCAELFLKRHITTQHTKNRKPEFNCKFCEKKFYSKIGCDLHVGTHTGETLGCELCAARFTGEESRKKHMLRKHTAKTVQLTSDSETAKRISLQTKEELMQDQKFLDEEI